MIESSTSFPATSIKSASSSTITTIYGIFWSCSSSGNFRFFFSIKALYPAIFFVLDSSNRSYLLSISATAFLRAILAFLGSVTTGVSRWGIPL